MERISPLWERMPAQPFRQTDLMSLSSSPSLVSTGRTSEFGKLFADAVQSRNASRVGANILDNANILTANPITDIFAQSINAVRETDIEKNQMEYLMATGQLDNPAPLLIATSKAQLAVDLLVQLRNRATDAYNELMRINL